MAVAGAVCGLIHHLFPDAPGPGGPWDKEKQLAPQVIENLNKKYGLDKPFVVQFGNYIWGVLHGDLGVSYMYQDRGVTSILLEGLPKTATLGIVAFLLSLIIGVPFGMFAALRQNSMIDYASVMFSTILPVFPLSYWEYFS
jgi:oligopeptide transport system permease protein